MHGVRSAWYSSSSDKKEYKESFGTLVELISDEDAATLMPEADEVELDKVIDAAIDRVLAKKAS